nr:oligopeptide transporter 4-like [Ipomoea batatas]
MRTVEMEAPKIHEGEINDDEVSPIEQVRLTVPNTDDPTLPVWTFRMWVLGVLSCVLLSFLNQFFSYRKEPLTITQITVQVATLPIGRFMAGFGSREFSLNPGPFNMKEHVLISIFGNAGYAFGDGTAYGVGIVTIIIAFYQRKISLFTGWLLVLTTQILGYGWAGLLRKYVVEPAEMWWPSTLVQISLFRTLHEKEIEDEDGKRYMSRAKFFLIVLTCSFCWYLFPGYLFQTLQSISWVCWTFPKSVTAQQIGSGMNGLGIGAFTLDWATIASFLSSPLITPFFAIANIFVGYVSVMYVVIPICYWGFNVFDAKNFPMYSSRLFTAQGQEYNISAIVNDQFELDKAQYAKQGRVHLSIMFSVLTYGLGFAKIASTISHVALFHGR